MIRRWRCAVRSVTVIGVLFLVGCAEDFTLYRVDPLRAGMRDFSSQHLAQAGIRAQEKGQNDEAAGFSLEALEEIDSNSFYHRPNNEAATKRNYITARLVEICAPQGAEAVAPLVALALLAGSYLLRGADRRTGAPPLAT